MGLSDEDKLRATEQIRTLLENRMAREFLQPSGEYRSNENRAKKKHYVACDFSWDVHKYILKSALTEVIISIGTPYKFAQFKCRRPIDFNTIDMTITSRLGKVREELLVEKLDGGYVNSCTDMIFSDSVQFFFARGNGSADLEIATDFCKRIIDNFDALIDVDVELDRCKYWVGADENGNIVHATSVDGIKSLKHNVKCRIIRMNSEGHALGYGNNYSLNYDVIYSIA